MGLSLPPPYLVSLKSEALRQISSFLQNWERKVTWLHGVCEGIWVANSFLLWALQPILSFSSPRALCPQVSASASRVYMWSSVISVPPSSHLTILSYVYFSWFFFFFLVVAFQLPLNHQSSSLQKIVCFMLSLFFYFEGLYLYMIFVLFFVCFFTVIFKVGFCEETEINIYFHILYLSRSPAILFVLDIFD